MTSPQIRGDVFYSLFLSQKGGKGRLLMTFCVTFAP